MSPLHTGTGGGVCTLRHKGAANEGGGKSTGGGAAEGEGGREGGGGQLSLKLPESMPTPVARLARWLWFISLPGCRQHDSPVDAYGSYYAASRRLR